MSLFDFKEQASEFFKLLRQIAEDIKAVRTMMEEERGRR